MLSIDRSAQRHDRQHVLDAADEFGSSDDDGQPVTAQRFRLARPEQRRGLGKHIGLGGEMRKAAAVMEKMCVELVDDYRDIVGIREFSDPRDGLRGEHCPCGVVRVRKDEMAHAFALELRFQRIKIRRRSIRGKP